MCLRNGLRWILHLRCCHLKRQPSILICWNGTGGKALRKGVKSNDLCGGRGARGEDGIFVDELTQVGFASRIMMPVYKPRTFISTGYQGTLGYGFPTALGVKVAKPETPVISIAGDGGFMFAMQELATAVQQKIGLVTLIFNNNQYGNVQQMQKNLYGKSFGAQAFRTTTLEQLRHAIRQGFAVNLPTLIEVPIGDVPSTDRFRKLGRVRPRSNS
jgi:acetolactate synthase-1/2/3 large subunit